MNAIQPDLTSVCQEKVHHARTELARLSRPPQSADQTPEIDQKNSCLDGENDYLATIPPSIAVSIFVLTLVVETVDLELMINLIC